MSYATFFGISQAFSVAVWFRMMQILILQTVSVRLKYSKNAKYLKILMSHLVEKPAMWFPNRSDTNRPVQLQKQAGSLKFWIYLEEGLYYPSSENKGADQLRGHREADLRLCFRICRLLVFPWGGSFVSCVV